VPARPRHEPGLDAALAVFCVEGRCVVHRKQLQVAVGEAGRRIRAELGEQLVDDRGHVT
jgi:hypothetical protein